MTFGQYLPNDPQARKRPPQHELDKLCISEPHTLEAYWDLEQGCTIMDIARTFHYLAHVIVAINKLAQKPCARTGRMDGRTCMCC